MRPQSIVAWQCSGVKLRSLPVWEPSCSSVGRPVLLHVRRYRARCVCFGYLRHAIVVADALLVSKVGFHMFPGLAVRCRVMSSVRSWSFSLCCCLVEVVVWPHTHSHKKPTTVTTIAPSHRVVTEPKHCDTSNKSVRGITTTTPISLFP